MTKSPNTLRRTGPDALLINQSAWRQAVTALIKITQQPLQGAERDKNDNHAGNRAVQAIAMRHTDRRCHDSWMDQKLSPLCEIVMADNARMRFAWFRLNKP